jgi:hypothetical protein
MPVPYPNDTGNLSRITAHFTEIKELLGSMVPAPCVDRRVIRLLQKLKAVQEKHEFIMAGGTALALQIGHRVSVDIDLFTPRRFSTQTLFQEVERLKLRPLVQQESEGTLTVLLNGVQTSFLHYPYPFVQDIVHQDGIALAGVLDIAAMKVMAANQRGARRDFVDLYFILKDVPFRKVATTLVRRYGAHRINPINIGKSLIYFTDAETDPEPRFCGKLRPRWPEVKKFFKDNIRQMVLDLQSSVEP